MERSNCEILRRRGYKKDECNIPAVKTFLEKKGIPCNNGARCVLSWREDIWPIIANYMDSNTCSLRIPPEKEEEVFAALEKITASPCSWAEKCLVYMGGCKFADQIFCEPVPIQNQKQAAG